MHTHLGKSGIRVYILSSFFAALTAVGAFVRIPFFYVPFTMQDLFVVLSGSVLGPVFGALSQTLYLTVGLLGVPIFANGGGPAYILQPTFGYLLAFPLAAFVVGYLLWGKSKPAAATSPTFLRMVWANSIGLLVVFTVGVLFLYLNLKLVLAKPLSLSTALWSGCVIFIPGEIIKILICPFITMKLLKLIA